MKKLFPITLFAVFVLAQSAYCQPAPRFDFVPGQTRVIFTAGSTLHGFHGTAREAEGFAQGDLEHFGNGAAGMLKVRVADMTTDSKSRDRNMLESLEEEKYPYIVFSLKSASLSFISDDRARAMMNLAGDLEMHGVKKPVVIPAEITWAGTSIRIRGRKELSLKDFMIKPASFLFFHVKDNVVVEFDVTGKERTDRSADAGRD